MPDLNYQLPTPIGSPIYILESCYCGKDYAEHNCRMVHGPQHGNTSAIAIIKLPDPNKGFYRARCIKIYIRPFDPIKHLSKWGKTAFATETEAIETAKSKK